MDKPLEVSEVRRYRKALRQFQRLAGVQMRNCGCGVTLTQCLVLLDIDEHGHLTMGQLASILKLDHSTLSRTVDSLVKNKLVARLRDESDRRLVWIRLTEQGISLCEKIHQGNDEYCLQVFETIPATERATVIRHFETLIQAYLDYEVSIEEQE